MRLSTGMSRAPLEATGTLQSPELVTGLPPRGLKTTEGHKEGEELPQGGGRVWVRRAETFSRRSRTVRRNPPGGPVPETTGSQGTCLCVPCRSTHKKTEKDVSWIWRGRWKIPAQGDQLPFKIMLSTRDGFKREKIAQQLYRAVFLKLFTRKKWWSRGETTEPHLIISPF